jgi:hypothetical protein
MGVEEDLHTLRADFPGCTVIAYADLDTRIVLVSSSEGAARRDTLDGLCAGAVDLFAAAERAGEASADTVMRSHGGRIEVSLRDPERRDDALCAICQPGTDLGGYLSRAREVLRALGQEGGA